MGTNCQDPRLGTKSQEIFSAKIDCHYRLPTVLYLTTTFQINSQRANHQRGLHNCGPNWTRVALSIKMRFLGKAGQHWFGLLYPIILHKFKKTLREQIMRIRLHNFCQNCPLLEKRILLENWLILLMSNYCTPLC